MGSSDIRRLIKDEDPIPEFSISGPESARSVPVRERVKQVFKRLDLDTDAESKKELERVLEAHDLYTKKARFSSTVHYLDKKTDKTVFVDTGKVIALRRTGITESGVKLALQMAQSRFGSTLTINGNSEFKRLVIEAAAKNNLDIHFTDKVMNERLAERRAELELERDSHTIASPGEQVLDTAEHVPSDLQSSGESAARSDVTKGSLVDHGSAPYMMDKKNDESYYVVVKNSSGIRTLWGTGLADLMKDGGYLQGQAIQITDKGSEPVIKQVINKATGVREPKQFFRRIWEIDPAPVRDQASPATTSSALATSVAQSATSEPTFNPTEAGPAAASPASAAPAGRAGTEEKLVSIPGLSPNAEARRVEVVDPPALLPTLVTEKSAAESFIIDRELTFRNSMGGLTEAEIQSSTTMMEWRASDHATWLLSSADSSAAGAEFLSSYLDNQFYRESFLETIGASLEVAEDLPEMLAGFEPALEIAQALVSAAEDRDKLVPGQAAVTTAVETVDPVIEVLTVDGAKTSTANKNGQASRNTKLAAPKPKALQKPSETKKVIASKSPAAAKEVTGRQEVEQPAAVVAEAEEVEMAIDN